MKPQQQFSISKNPFRIIESHFKFFCAQFFIYCRTLFELTLHSKFKQLTLERKAKACMSLLVLHLYVRKQEPLNCSTIVAQRISNSVHTVLTRSLNIIHTL
mgnify:CR=1 FL=1